MSQGFTNIKNGINVQPTTLTPLNGGDIASDSVSGDLIYHNGTAPEHIQTSNNTATLTNKSINGNNNTLSNIPVSSATGVLSTTNGGTGVNSTLTFPTSGTVVSNNNNVTLTSKTIGDNLTFTEVSTPSNPGSGQLRLYPKNDDKLYTLSSSGVETAIGGIGVGSLAVTGNTPLINNVTLSQSGAITLAQTGQNITIGATPVTFVAPTVRTFSGPFTYVFTLSTMPSGINAGDTYTLTNTGPTAIYTVVSTTSTTLTATGYNNPPSTAILTKVTGSGNATLSYTGQPTQSNFFNYIPPTSPAPLYIKVRMAGGGGGGSGSGITGTGSAGNGNIGQTTFFSTFASCTGGSNGQFTTGPFPGGTASVVSPAIPLVLTTGMAGGPGSNTSTSNDIIGGIGGNNGFVGAGVPTQDGDGGNAVANTGCGGAGGSMPGTTNARSGGAGGAGAYAEFMVPGPLASSYTVTIGSGGYAGSAGGSGHNGGCGASGCVIVTEYYQ